MKAALKVGTYEKESKVNGNTYIRICAGPQRNEYVHRLVAEAMLGRKLRDDEHVHHKDGDTLNNSWENLEVMTLTAHMAHHADYKWEKGNGHRHG